MSHSRQEDLEENHSHISMPTNRYWHKKKNIIILFSVSFSLIIVTSITMIIFHSNNSNFNNDKLFPVDYIVSVKKITNETEPVNLCHTEYKIPNSNKRVNICQYQGETRVDIRTFLSGKATIKGIFLNRNEWKELMKLTLRINDILRNYA